MTLNKIHEQFSILPVKAAITRIVPSHDCELQAVWSEPSALHQWEHALTQKCRVRVETDEWEMTCFAFETLPLTRIAFEMQMRFFFFIKSLHWIFRAALVGEFISFLTLNAKMKFKISAPRYLRFLLSAWFIFGFDFRWNVWNFYLSNLKLTVSDL